MNTNSSVLSSQSIWLAKLEDISLQHDFLKLVYPERDFMSFQRFQHFGLFDTCFYYTIAYLQLYKSNYNSTELSEYVL